MTPKRVKITYSVDFNEVLDEVARLVGSKAMPDLIQANEFLNEATNLLRKKSALTTIECMREVRDLLAGVDYLLEDSMGILLGYVSAKSGDTAQELAPQEAVDPYDMPKGATDEEG
tara:strand:- start:2891 stop:3238 length:348 start_codon:yes stop_codon:yes gene_type:complete